MPILFSVCETLGSHWPSATAPPDTPHAVNRRAQEIPVTIEVHKLTVV